MKTVYTKNEEVEMVKFLTFRKEDPRISRHTFMALKNVAKFLGKSTAYVHKICTELRRGKHRGQAVNEEDKDRQSP